MTTAHAHKVSRQILHDYSGLVPQQVAERLEERFAESLIEECDKSFFRGLDKSKNLTARRG